MPRRDAANLPRTQPGRAVMNLERGGKRVNELVPFGVVRGKGGNTRPAMWPIQVSRFGHTGASFSAFDKRELSLSMTFATCKRPAADLECVDGA